MFQLHQVLQRLRMNVPITPAEVVILCRYFDSKIESLEAELAECKEKLNACQSCGVEDSTDESEPEPKPAPAKRGRPAKSKTGTDPSS